MNQSSKESAAKHESAKKPGKDDVHEQHEHGQPREGAVREVGTRDASPAGMNNPKSKPEPQTKPNGVEEKDGAGVRFVPSEEPAKIEPTPETAREHDAHH